MIWVRYTPKPASQLERLFPNMQTHVPDGNEEEPASDADDDYEEPEARGRDAQRARAEVGRAEYSRAADMAVAAGVPQSDAPPAKPLLQPTQPWMPWQGVASSTDVRMNALCTLLRPSKV